MSKEIKWYRKRAMEGDLDAQFELAQLCEKGNGTPQDLTEAVKWYQTAAEKGHAASQFELSKKFYYGHGIEKDVIRAVEWVVKSADQGHPEAQHRLATHYYFGDGVPKDLNKAMDWIRKAAESGHADSQLNLALSYEHGNGVPQDVKESVKWYRMAAENGHVDAQNNLAVMYQKGRGVPVDYQEAVKWYRMAAEGGEAVAQFNLAFAYEHGQGVQQDTKQAIEWYRKAAKAGYSDAQYNLGLLYQKGVKVPQNHAEALKWFTAAAEKGDPAAQFNVAVMYANGQGVKQNNQKAFQWYKLAAENGNIDAQFNLALMYEGVEGVPRNYQEALRWYKKAAELGDAAALNNVALFYEQGMGVPINPTEAAQWYRKAAERGDASAQFNLGIKFETGNGVDKNTDEAAVWYARATMQGHINARNNLLLMDEHELTNDEEKVIVAAIMREQEMLRTQAPEHFTDPIENEIANINIRANHTAKYGIETPDWVNISFVCKACDRPLEDGVVTIMGFVTYQNIPEMIKALLVISRQPTGHQTPTCTKCGATGSIACVDFHSFQSRRKKDLVGRCLVQSKTRSGLSYKLMWWNPTEGYVSAEDLTEEDIARFGHDALIRKAACARGENSEELVATVRQIQAEFPGDGSLLHFLKDLVVAGEKGLADEIVAEYVEKNPNDPEGLVKKADFLILSVAGGMSDPKALDEAEQLLNRASEFDSSLPFTDLSRCNLLRVRGDEQGAVNAFQNLINKFPEFAPGYYNLGLIYLERDPAEALDLFSRGEEIAGEDPDYALGRTKAHLALGHFTEAQQALDRVRELNPTHPKIAELQAGIASGSN